MRLPYKPCSRLQSGLESHPVPVRDSLRVQLDADDLASRQPRQVQRGPTGTTRDVQETARLSQLKPTCEPLELLNRQPAVLADVLTKRRPPNLPMHLRGKLPVLSAVMVRNFWLLSHRSSLARQNQKTLQALVENLG